MHHPEDHDHFAGHQGAAPAEPGYPEHPEVSADVASAAHEDHRHGDGSKPGARHAQHDAYDAHAGHSVAMFRDKFWLSLALTIPTLMWGHMLQNATGYAAPSFPGSTWIPAVFGTAVFLYEGTPFLRGDVQELRDRLPGMMTLIGIAISVAFLFSAMVTVGYPGMPLCRRSG